MSRATKASIAKTAERSWAVLVMGLERQDYLAQPFGRQLDDARRVAAFKASAKRTHVGAKGRATLAAVRCWVRENAPSQFFAAWPSDSAHYKDDAVEIWFTE